MEGINQITGSRNLDSNVPIVNFNAGKAHVNWNYPDNRNDKWRARSEVFFSISAPWGADAF